MPTTTGQCLVSYFALMFAVCLAKDAHIVGRWADKLGTDLWELATEVARPEELLEKYRSMNTRVEDKSGEELVSIISENVGRMLRRKMDAVTCIRIAAEAATEDWNEPLVDGNFSYVSGKCSPVNGYSMNDTQCERENASVYRNMELTADSHFYNIPVNTSHSSVHIPTNVFDLTQEVVEDIMRTELLDDMFRQNYESDPALSWQYFGSVTGMLRQYPAMQWRTSVEDDDTDEKPADLYDCRVRSWFIEAATCSKDVVILIDVSGSMTGMGKTIAKTTVNSILDTLSNNDFVTLLKYSNETTELVPCFKDMLIQATPENLDTFKKSLDTLKTEGPANLTDAFTKAFSLLKTYRESRGCDADTPCNQLIMVVTDGIAGNLTEIFEKWNREENGTHIPVRVFPFLLGMEVTKVREIQRMACLNRGSCKHVHTREEVREQVLKYIPVVARPLVIQGVVHPIVWTHVYADITNPALAAWLWRVMEHEDQKSRLQKYFKGKQLGVRLNEDAIYITQLGKDENIEEDPFTLNTTAWQEYRLLTSVGTPVFDHRNKQRDNNTRVVEDALFGVAGTDVPIDDIRKLTLPYKLGVNGYAFIVSNNGYVILHPDLRPVYKGQLKMNYNSVDLTEVEILDDGRGPRNPGPEILELRSALVDHKHGSMKGIPVKLHYDDNRRVTLEKRNYFYAPLPGTPFGLAVALPVRSSGGRSTPLSGADESTWLALVRTVRGLSIRGRRPRSGAQLRQANAQVRRLLLENLPPKARNLAELYGIFIRFIATQSGLTRWHHLNISKLADADDGIVFGDLHRRAVNEPWYKGAIFQNEMDPNSIFLSVPWEAGTDAVVTASMTLSPKDGGKKAPAAVVGFQMSMADFYKRFIALTSVTTNPDMNCSNKWIDCYLLDQNGYVVISGGHNDTGQFMGTLEGAIMTSMIGQGLYNSFDIYDYQAWCHEVRISNSANNMMEPLRYVGRLLVWFLLRLIWFATQFVNLPGIHAKVHNDEDAPAPPPPPTLYLYHYPCDQKRTLYMLNETIAAKGITNHSDYCSRPFYAQRVTHTNLLLVVVNSMYPTCYKRLEVTPVSISPLEYTNSTADKPCHKIPLNALKRRRLKSCFTEHPLELEIDCGGSSELTMSLLLLWITVFRTLYAFV